MPIQGKYVSRRGSSVEIYNSAALPKKSFNQTVKEKRTHTIHIISVISLTFKQNVTKII